jgi:hypothetical protein
MSAAGIPLGDLKHLAQGMDEATFKKQIGPLVLLKRPDRDILSVGESNRATRQLPAVARISPELVRREVNSFTVLMLPPVRDADVLRVGRAADNDVVLEHPSASKYHAEFVWDGKSCKVKDLGAKNQVFVNGILVKGERPLKEGDVIAMGAEDFVYFDVQKLYWLLTGA